MDFTVNWRCWRAELLVKGAERNVLIDWKMDRFAMNTNGRGNLIFT